MRLHGAIFAVLLLGGASGCGATVYVGTPPASGGTQAPDRSTSPEQARVAAAAGQTQRPGTCQVAPPQVHIPTGEWTATETILTTYAIDVCAGERRVRPWDFRRICRAGNCKTYLYTVSYYGVRVAEVVPVSRGRYVATFRPDTVPCPHRPEEDAGTNQNHETITLWWSRDKQALHGLSREYQVGDCGRGAVSTSSDTVVRTYAAANPPAQGP